MSLRAIISIAGAVGAGGGITSLTLWQTGQFGSINSNVNSSVTSTSSGLNTENLTALQTSSSPTSSVVKNTIEENCEVIATAGENIAQSLGIKEDDYTVVFCKDTNSKDSKKKISNNWTGLFPNDLLRLRDENHTIKTRFNIETNTKTLNLDEDEEDESEDEKYETTFKGNGFLFSPMVGKWENDSENVSGKSVTRVSVEDLFGVTHTIYLLFPAK